MRVASSAVGREVHSEDCQLAGSVRAKGRRLTTHADVAVWVGDHRGAEELIPVRGGNGEGYDHDRGHVTACVKVQGRSPCVRLGASRAGREEACHAGRGRGSKERAVGPGESGPRLAGQWGPWTRYCSDLRHWSWNLTRSLPSMPVVASRAVKTVGGRRPESSSCNRGRFGGEATAARSTAGIESQSCQLGVNAGSLGLIRWGSRGAAAPELALPAAWGVGRVRVAPSAVGREVHSEDG